MSSEVGAADGSVTVNTESNRKKKRRHSDADSNGGDSFDTKHFNVLLERLADGGERDLEMRAEALQQEKELIDMRKKALQQEKNLAIQKRIDNLRDKIDELEVEYDKTERDIYRQIINRKRTELEELEKQLE